MLNNDFFKIIDLDLSGNELLANVALEPGHIIYKGHFPGNPVTPGVVQMQMVKEILEVFYNKKLQLKTMGRCKFLHILDPNDISDLAVKNKHIIVGSSLNIIFIDKDKYTKKGASSMIIKKR